MAEDRDDTCGLDCRNDLAQVARRARSSRLVAFVYRSTESIGLAVNLVPSDIACRLATSPVLGDFKVWRV